MEGALKKLLAAADAEPGLDTIMFDYCVGDGKSPCTVGDYTRKNFDTAVMTGTEFLKKIPVAYTVWNYIYRRDHLLSTGFLFAENVMLEDTDFSLKYIARSEAVRFLPILVYYNCFNPSSVTRQLSNLTIQDIVRMNRRVFTAAAEEKAHSPEASRCILNHAVFCFREYLNHYIWRIPFKEQKSILREWRPDEPTGDTLTDFVRSHPVITAVALTSAKPFLSLASKAKRCLKTR